MKEFNLFYEKNHRVNKDLGNSYQTIQDTDKDMDKEKDKDSHQTEFQDKDPEIVLPFNSEVFKNKWELWKAYRKEIKKPIKGVISEQAALKDLSEIAHLNENLLFKL